MSLPEIPEQKIAPAGAIFLPPEEVAAMMGDFGVQRTVGIMTTGEFPLGERPDKIVAAVLRATVQPPPELGQPPHSRLANDL